MIVDLLQENDASGRDRSAATVIRLAGLTNPDGNGPESVIMLGSDFGPTHPAHNPNLNRISPAMAGVFVAGADQDQFSYSALTQKNPPVMR